MWNTFSVGREIQQFCLIFSKSTILSIFIDTYRVKLSGYTDSFILRQSFSFHRRHCFIFPQADACMSRQLFSSNPLRFRLVSQLKVLFSPNQSVVWNYKMFPPFKKSYNKRD